MATYAIGDVQGCFAELEALLARVDFSPARDRVWLVGDLVNRGPRSLEVLRWAVEHDGCVVAVLGNHDLHLLARDLGVVSAKRRDTLDEILAAPDRARLIAWLRARPLVHRESGYLLVHAGIHPAWRITDAEAHATDAASALRGDDAGTLLAASRAMGPVPWKPKLRGTRRHVSILQSLVTMRTLHDDGAPCDHKGAPADAPDDCRPWFDHRRPAPDDPTVLFGHWAALGLHVGDHAIGLDTGCVWGGALTAMRLEDRTLFHQPALPR